MGAAEHAVAEVLPLEKARGRLRERLGREQLGAGARLRSERALAESLGVSVRATAAALSEMTAEGLVTRERGRGTFLTAKGAQWAMGPRPALTLGLLLHDRIGMSSAILTHLARPAAARGILPSVSYTGWDPYHETAVLEMMQQQATTIVAFVPCPRPAALQGFYATLPERFPMHFVSLIREIAPEMDAITFDYRAAGARAAQRALERGAHDVLFCGMDDGLMARQCVAGIEAARGRRAGAFVFGTLRRPETASELCARVRGLPRPLAIVAKNQREAITAATLLRTQGLQVPEEVAFTAFDFCADPYLADFPSTMLVPPCGALAELLVKRVEDCAEGRARDPMHVSLVLRGEEREPRDVAETFAGDEGL